MFICLFIPVKFYDANYKWNKSKAQIMNVSTDNTSVFKLCFHLRKLREIQTEIPVKAVTGDVHRKTRIAQK